MSNKPLMAILDDEEALREILKSAFEERGFRVVSTSDKQRFFDCMGEAGPDIIISDVRSQPLDGLSFLEKLKASDRFKTIPVIFVTGLWSARALLYQKGAYAAFAKPFEIEELFRCVDRALGPQLLS